MLPIPKESQRDPDFKVMVNRLLGREEMIAQGGKRLGDLPSDIRQRFDSEAGFACADCNAGICKAHR